MATDCRGARMPGTDGVEITGPSGDRYDEILTPEAIGLIAMFHRELAPRRAELLAARDRREADIIAGGTLDFLPETKNIREDPTWRVAQPAPGLIDRRGENPGPAGKKKKVNALNHAGKVG